LLQNIIYIWLLKKHCVEKRIVGKNGTTPSKESINFFSPIHSLPKLKKFAGAGTSVELVAGAAGESRVQGDRGDGQPPPVPHMLQRQGDGHLHRQVLALLLPILLLRPQHRLLDHFSLTRHNSSERLHCDFLPQGAIFDSRTKTPLQKKWNV